MTDLTELVAQARKAADLLDKMEILTWTATSCRTVADTIEALAAEIAALTARAEAAEAKVANERSIWVTAIETYFDATAVMDVETYARKLRLEITK